MKLLPQFSIRLMLGVTAVAAGLFSIVGLGIRGHGWAIGVTMGVASIVIMLGTGAVLFGILWVFSLASSGLAAHRITAPGSRPQGAASPFAPVQPRSPFADSPIDAIVIDAPVSAPPAMPGQGETAPGDSP